MQKSWLCLQLCKKLPFYRAPKGIVPMGKTQSTRQILFLVINSMPFSSFWTVVMEKTLESPLDCKEIQPIHPKGDQSWVFIGRTDVEAEIPILWPPDAKSWLTGKAPDAGKDWEQEEKEVAGWDGWMASLTQWTWVWANFGRVKDKEAWSVAVHGVEKSRTQLNDWTTSSVLFLRLIHPHGFPPFVLSMVRALGFFTTSLYQNKKGFTKWYAYWLTCWLVTLCWNKFKLNIASSRHLHSVSPVRL